MQAGVTYYQFSGRLKLVCENLPWKAFVVDVQWIIFAAWGPKKNIKAIFWCKVWVIFQRNPLEILEISKLTPTQGTAVSISLLRNFEIFQNAFFCKMLIKFRQFFRNMSSHDLNASKDSSLGNHHKSMAFSMLTLSFFQVLATLIPSFYINISFIRISTNSQIIAWVLAPCTMRQL